MSLKRSLFQDRFFPDTQGLSFIAGFAEQSLGYSIHGREGVRLTTHTNYLTPSNQAITSAKETSGLVHQSDHGGQHVSIVYNEQLAKVGITPSTGTVGDSYDNALAENVNGSYENELIHTRTWSDVLEVEIATFEWVNWWNQTRPDQGLDYRTPEEVETEYWQQQAQSATIENRVNA